MFAERRRRRWLPYLAAAVVAAGGWAGSGRGAPAGEAGHPFLQNFSPLDYGARSQNWAATQDAQGVMYFGNQGVVLQYDGVTWRKIPINAVTDVIRGLDADPASGTVFVGGLNEIGYLASPTRAETRFVSLLDRLPAADRGFRAVHRVFATPQGVFFCAEQQVMRWRDGGFRTWKFPTTHLVRYQWVSGHLYAQEPSLGLLRLDGDAFVPASADPLFRRTTVMTMAADADGAITVGTLRDGLFTLRGDQVATQDSECNAFFQAKEIRRSLRLRDGTLAVATGSGGVILLDAAGRFLDRWDQASGLQNEAAMDLFQDREGGVWQCLSAGLARVEAHAPLTVFDRGNGFKPSFVHSLARCGGTLYVSTGAGLYRIVAADAARAVPAHAEPVPGLESDCWSACAFDGSLLVADNAGVLLVDEAGQGKRIFKDGFSGSMLRRSRVQPTRVFLGRRNELRSLRRDGGTDRWIDEGRVPGVEAEIHALEETPNGDVWLGTNDRGVVRVRFAASPDGVSRGAATVTGFAGQPGPVSKEIWTRVAQTPAGELLVAGKGGLYRLDGGGEQFEVAREYGADFAGGAYRFDDIAPGAQGDLWYDARPADGVWLEQELGRAGAGPVGVGAARRALPHRIVRQISVVDCVSLDDGCFWMAGPGGLVRLDIDQWQHDPAAARFATLIREAEASDRAAPDAGTPLTAGETLPYARNSLRFGFAANTFAVGAGLSYQTRLDGFGSGGWSPFGQRTEVEYTNLPEGAYALEVRARDADGRLGVPAGLAFRVLPPWERTSWAYLGYLLAAGASVAGIVRWRLRALRAANLRLERLVEARTSALRANEEDLIRAKELAVEANRAKSVFLANMSHELRTPLNAILGYANILLKDRALSERNHERLDVMRQSGSHLLTMINEVLDLSKIEAGKLTLVPTCFSLEELVDEVGGAFRQRAVEKGLELQTLLAPEGLATPVQTDAGKLRQVLFNLLGNAIKFTERGSVQLEVTMTANGGVRFAVTDTGVGILPEEQRSIFLAFHQAARTQGHVQGTGLGLAISQRLVELLGGRLEVGSQPGRGSRFWFDLALPTAEAAQRSAPSFQGQTVVGFRGRTRRVLVVDDEPVNRQILRELLEPLGFEITEAGSGAECLERCGETAFDALLLDLRMPQGSGLEVASTLRRAEAAGGGGNSRVKIIAVSASVFESDRQEALDAGCDDFVPKPFQEGQLFAALGRALDLEWVLEEALVAAAASRPEEGDPNTDRSTEGQAIIDTLLELSRRGDILGLRRQLQTLLAAKPAGTAAPYLYRLEPLVAAYQMNRIRDILLELKQGSVPA